MEKLSPTVQSFTVEVNGHTCEINDIPNANLGSDTAEKSEVSEDYIIGNSEYIVSVHVNYYEVTVEVKDSHGNPVNNFTITNIQEKQ